MTTLKINAVGPEVREVKEFLNDEGFYKGPIDDKFDAVLQNAVIIFQKQFNLKPDGIIGTKETYPKFFELGFKKEGNEVESVGFKNEDVRAIIAANAHKLVADKNINNEVATGFDPQKHVIAVAIRGFDLDEGVKGQNDRQIWDDRVFIVTPNDIKVFECNTDPNGFRKGYGTGSNKGMACLKKGVWFFGKGTHKGTPAFRQCVPFTVTRDGNPPYDDTGYHAINWHSGGQTSTSSLGCQTLKPNDFSSLRSYVYDQMEKCDNPKMKNDWKQEVRAIPYILIEEVDRRKGILTV
jgi:lysozyme